MYTSRSPSGSKSRAFTLTVTCLLLLELVGCNSDRGKTSGSQLAPVVVIGIDGAEWNVINNLWSQNQLPNLRALADRGTSSVLATIYNSSPVIWTTIATGVVPERHGITGFVLPTEKGDVPVSSAVRKVPALWNMLSVADRRVAVLGWWASWPAEEVDGVVISDRALLEVERGFYAPGLKDEIDAMLRSVDERELGGNRVEQFAERKDLLAAMAADRLLTERFDLMLVFFRAVDVSSHRYWKYYEPEKFDFVEPTELERFARKIPDSYIWVDQQIGRLVEAATADTNFVVLSDHGFHAREQEDLQIGIDFDLVLAELGFLIRSEAGIDMTRSKLFTYSTGKGQREKKVRYALRGRDPGGGVSPSQRSRIRRRLEKSLSRVHYESGAQIFRVKDATPSQVEKGADFVVEVLTQSASRRMYIDGAHLKKGIVWFAPLSGDHSPGTHGIFIAAGPDIETHIDLDGISIKDITPTLLYALDLPVAEDFDGIPRIDLFTEKFRHEHPLRRVESWGTMDAYGVMSSAVDHQVLDELRALGYIN